MNPTNTLKGNIGSAVSAPALRKFNNRTSSQSAALQAKAAKAAAEMEAGCVTQKPLYENGEILTLLNNNLDAIRDVQGAFQIHFDRIAPILALNRPDGTSGGEPDFPSMSSTIGDRLMHQNVLLMQLLNNIQSATDLVAL